MSPPRKTDIRWTSLRPNTFSQEQVLENMRTYQIHCPPCRLLNIRTKRLHIPHIPRALYGAGVVWCSQPCWLTAVAWGGGFPVPSLLIVKCRRRIVYSYNQLTHGYELVTSVVVADSALAASVIGAVEVVVVAIVVARPRILRVMLLAGAFFSWKIENETCHQHLPLVKCYVYIFN